MTASRRVPRLPTDLRLSSSSFDRWNERCSGVVVAELNNGGSKRAKSVRFATDGLGGPLCRVHEISQDLQNDPKQQVTTLSKQTTQQETNPKPSQRRFHRTIGLFNSDAIRGHSSSDSPVLL